MTETPEAFTARIEAQIDAHFAKFAPAIAAINEGMARAGNSCATNPTMPDPDAPRDHIAPELTPDTIWQWILTSKQAQIVYDALVEWSSGAPVGIQHEIAELRARLVRMGAVKP